MDYIDRLRPDSKRPFSWVRKDLTEHIEQAKVRIKIAEETLKEKQEKLEHMGLDAALDVMEKKKKSRERISELLNKSEESLAKFLEENGDKFNDDRNSRIYKRALESIVAVQEVRDRLSTHPMINTKQVSISKVDNRQVNLLSNDLARERLERFKNKVEQPQALDAD